MKFDNKISIDGVAVILAVIGFAFWLGKLSMTVKENTSDIQAEHQWLDKLQATQNTEAQNLSALTAIVNEKIKNDP